MAKVAKKKVATKKSATKKIARKAARKPTKRNPLKVAEKNAAMTYKKVVAAERALDRATTQNTKAIHRVEAVKAKLAAKAA